MPPNKPTLKSKPEQPQFAKPYELIPFPSQKPSLKRPVGHDQYQKNCWHGALHLKLTVVTALHVSTGVVVMGSDVGSNVGDRPPLIKTMMQNSNRVLMIPGSSLKGAIRSVYEAITNSTLGVGCKDLKKEQIPDYRRPCSNKEKLCPASLVFGALNWQGLVNFSDAEATMARTVTGFMPSLYSPSPEKRQAYFKDGKVAGRKFYYTANEAIEGGDRGIPVQQAGTAYEFVTQINFRNLAPEELGTLLIVLGQDANYPLALRVGGGKPVGMGTMTVEVTQMNVYKNVRSRYTSYTPPSTAKLTGTDLQIQMQAMITAAHQHLIQKPQLEQLQKILSWPTQRQAPSGMY